MSENFDLSIPITVGAGETACHDTMGWSEMGIE
jgi:hypothetical protein